MGQLKLLLIVLLSTTVVRAAESSENRLIFINKEGTYTIALGWVTNDMGEEAFSSHLEFDPKYNKFTCPKSGFIQVAKVLDNNKSDFVWDKTSGQELRNQLKTKDGWFVDFNGPNCKKTEAGCSPFYVDHWSSEGQFGDSTQESKMADYPFGWTKFSRIELESCLVCVDDLQVYGCINYGATWDLTKNKEIIHPQWGFASSHFMEALKLFRNYFKESKSTE